VTLPRIGISGRLAVVEGAERSGVNGAYLRAVARAGGAPLVLSPLAGVAAVPALLDGVDALILSGGADVDPAHYGTPRHPKLGKLEPERDAFEFALFAEARARALPTLAICRGLQLANVALGGTLWQDLPSEKGDHPQSGARSERVHEIEVKEGSRLGDLLRSSRHRVNSFHHQAIRDLAPGLAGSAWSPDGLIEGVEIFSGWWFVGVQWHPEEFWAEADPADQGLFDALTTATRMARA
jgi:putative glutamine amidotransferase